MVGNLDLKIHIQMILMNWLFLVNQKHIAPPVLHDSWNEWMTSYWFESVWNKSVSFATLVTLLLWKKLLRDVFRIEECFLSVNATESRWFQWFIAVCTCKSEHVASEVSFCTTISVIPLWPWRVVNYSPRLRSFPSCVFYWVFACCLESCWLNRLGEVERRCDLV